MQPDSACVEANTRCYWTGYHDAKGNALTSVRGPGQELRQLTASDRQGITFQSDDQLRTTEAKATNGARVSYKYDENGCVARVERADKQVSLYKCDLAHQMTSFAVMRRPGARPETMLTNEYDPEGHVIKQTLKGVGSYRIQYLDTEDYHASQWTITTPGGEVWNVEERENGTYVVHREGQTPR